MDKKVKRNSLKKNFSWNFVGSMIYSATQWGLIIVFTRLGSVEMVGMYSLALAITAPIMMLTNIQLRTVQASSTRFDYKYSDFLSVRVITNILFILILLIMLFLSSYNKYTMIVIMLIGISKFIESFSDVSFGFFQQQERMDYIARSQILKGLLGLIVVTILILITKSLIISLFGLILSWLFVFLLYDLQNVSKFKEHNRPRFDIKNIKAIIILALPLGIIEMITSLNSNLPKILVDKYLGKESLGYFASIFYLVLIGSKFVNSIAQAALPRLAKLNGEGKISLFKKTLSKLVLISFLVGIMAIVVSFLFGDVLLVTIYGSEFTNYKFLLVLIMIYGMFDYVSRSLMIGLNSLRAFKIQPFLGAFWLFILFVLSIYFIPRYGLFGVGYSLITYSLVRMISLVIVIYFRIKKNYTMRAYKLK